MALSPRDKLAAGIARVVDAGRRPDGSSVGVAPYFGAVLRGLIRREISPEMGKVMEAFGMMPTMAVTNDGVLLWWPAFVSKCTTEELSGGLVHEVMHVVLKHAERAAGLGIVPEPSNDMFVRSRRWNTAADLAINTDVRKMCKLPSWVLFPEKFGFPEGLSAEAYYRLLEEWAKKNPASAQGPGAVGSGHCGGCTRHNVPGEPTATKGQGRSEAELERMRRATAEAVKEHASKHRETVPAGLERWADDYLKPAKIDWRVKLARLVRSAVAHKSGAVDFTWSRASRRQGGIGWGVGRPVVPALHAPVPQVAVALDTSGSMGNELLAAALSEVQGVLSACGAGVTFVVCDAAVHGIKPIKNVQEAMRMMKGGGGTAMEPAIVAISELKPKPQIAVVLTDGYCDDPDNHGLSLVWAIVGGNKQFKPTHGDVILVEEDEKAAA